MSKQVCQVTPKQSFGKCSECGMELVGPWHAFKDTCYTANISSPPFPNRIKNFSFAYFNFFLKKSVKVDCMDNESLVTFSSCYTKLSRIGSLVSYNATRFVLGILISGHM